LENDLFFDGGIVLNELCEGEMK